LHAYHELGVTRCPRFIGSAHPIAKLTEGEVFRIHELLSEGGRTHLSIANEFHVHKSNISVIARGKGWRHVYDAFKERESTS
jgi:hypothetical protein